MVIADGCEVIIMLCEFSEGGEDKCAKYYPDQVKGSLTFGPITIKCYGRSEEEVGCFSNCRNIWSSAQREDCDDAAGSDPRTGEGLRGPSL